MRSQVCAAVSLQERRQESQESKANLRNTEREASLVT